MTRILKAISFATKAHGNQKRKYTDEPYMVHPLEVAELLIRVGITDDDIIIAAILHDVVEDTEVSIEDVETAFGIGVRTLVYYLTDISQQSDGNRVSRKTIDRNHISCGPQDAKTIKLADLISNTRDICKHDPKFAKVYLEEKKILLPFLTGGNQFLWKLANELLSEKVSELEIGSTSPYRLRDTGSYKFVMVVDGHVYWTSSAHEATVFDVKVEKIIERYSKSLRWLHDDNSLEVC